MTSFLVVGIVMTAVALLWVVVPLWRRDEGSQDATEVARTNLAILRDQLAELEADRGRGTISASQFEGARTDLERRALEEAAPESTTKAPASTASRTVALVLAIVIPLTATAIYRAIGEPEGLRPERLAAEQQVAPAEVEKMVAGLAARLEKNPDDPRGWMMLARSYYVLQRMPEAASAYARAAEKIADDADLYADYADALAMSQGRRIEGKPLELVRRSLAIDPSQPKALAMAGTEAFNRKDFAGALEYWGKLLPLLPPDSEMAKSVAGGMAEARELGGAKLPPAKIAAGKPAPADTKSAVAGSSVSGKVTLSSTLSAQTAPQETLFIVARALNGPRIPLAVLRKRVADLPADFVLDDSLAMSPELKLSSFPEVIVTARISKSGNAISQRGDLQGASAPVKVGARNLAIVIDSVVP